MTSLRCVLACSCLLLATACQPFTEPGDADGGNGDTEGETGSEAPIVPQCHPLSQNCPPGFGCYPAGQQSGFSCAEAPETGGGYGDPCQFVNSCSPGFSCVSAEISPGCAMGFGCCSPYCDTEQDSCGGTASCTAYFSEGEAPPGFETVGLCA